MLKTKHLQKVQISLDISCFDLKGELKEDDKMKKYADMVKNLKVQYINHSLLSVKLRKRLQ
jgi:hypothetical protein